MTENAEDLGMFMSSLQIEATAVVTHPPGTKFDGNGNPIPPKDDDE
jgi:hypothetical protein